MHVSPTPPRFHIAIIGASISGLALAISLRQRPNVTYTLYEASATFDAAGAGIVFGPNALRAMELIDAQFRAQYDQIATCNSSAHKANVFYDMLLSEEGFGAGRAGCPAEGLAVAYEGFRKSGAHRRKLMGVMTGLVPVGAVESGKRAVGVRENGAGRVEVRFADGAVVEADAVVGCDGGKGVVRSAVLGKRYPDQVDATYSGRYVYRAIVPMADAREVLGNYAGDGKMFMGLERYFTTYQMSDGTQMNFLAARQNDMPWTHDQWTQEVTREEMIEDFEGCDPRLVKLLDWAKPIRWSLHHHLSTPTYYNGQICLLGDAAHASTPHQGAGAGQCLEDALILSSVLALVDRPQDLPHAFQAYDSICRPRAQEMVRTSDAAGRMYCFTDPDCGSDLAKIVANARARFTWIWDHDLRADVARAEEEFRRLVERSQVLGSGEVRAGSR